MLVSVIVPIYNTEQFLGRCIESICSQTYTRLQIILVDDGSTDSSGKICDDFMETDSRIRVVHKSNGGLVSARKQGLVLAEGEYVLNIDSDDWIEPDMIEHLCLAACESEAEVVCSGHYVEHDKVSQKVKNWLSAGVYHRREIEEQLFYNGFFYEPGVTPYLWSKLFRREKLIEKQNAVDDQICFGEDVAVVIPLLLSVEKIQILDYVGYHYVQHRNSMIHTWDGQETRRNLMLLKHLKNNLPDKSHGAVLRMQLSQFAKNLFLLRQIAWFDIGETQILLPYGGIPYGSRVVIYGAGALGKSVYQYLKETQLVSLVGWYDREYQAFEREGYPVQNPIVLQQKNTESFDCIIIAAIVERAARSIRKDLVDFGISEEKMRWLSDEFVDEKNELVMKWLALEEAEKQV